MAFAGIQSKLTDSDQRPAKNLKKKRVPTSLRRLSLESEISTEAVASERSWIILGDSNWNFETLRAPFRHWGHSYGGIPSLLIDHEPPKRHEVQIQVAWYKRLKTLQLQVLGWPSELWKMRDHRPSVYHHLQQRINKKWNCRSRNAYQSLRISDLHVQMQGRRCGQVCSMICRFCRSLEVILLPTLLYVQDTVGVQDKPRVCQLPLVRTF